MWQFLTNTVFRAPFTLVSKLFNSQIGVFVYAILSKWYIMVMLGSAVVAFWVLKGLEEAGVLSEAYEIVSTALEDSKAIAQHCTPKIKNLEALWVCINNLPKYRRTAIEQQLYDDVEEAINRPPQGSDPSSDGGSGGGFGGYEPGTDADPYSDFAQ